MNQGYDLKRVNRVSMFALLGISLLFGISILAAGAPISYMVPPIVVMIVTIVIYFIPMNSYIKGLIFALIPTISSTFSLVTGSFAVSNHYIYFMAISIVALYFSWKLIVAYGIVLNLIFIVMYLSAPASLLSSGWNSAYFSSTIVMLNGVLLLLYFLTSWGKKSINQALASTQQANEVMASLSSTMEQVENGTIILGENTLTMANNANETLESSRQVATAMDEIATGVNEQASSVSDIRMQVNAIAGDVEEAYNISQSITDSNNIMMEDVTSGEEQISEMSGQMTIIDDAINAAIVTVQDLEIKLDDIVNFLQVITNISSQTNLLALNASIESARAGEAGKGFAVVADEIRKLAEQSAASVNDINEIVNVVGQKSKDAVSTVTKGNEAVEKGTEIISRITTQYGGIKASFEASNKELNREIQMINQINDAFTEVNDKVTSIASISEEQSASSEEILSTVENQKNSIEDLTTSLVDIEKLSESLTSLIESHKDEV